MDLTEAIHAQTLIDWLTNPHATTGEQCDAARDAAACLADRAHQVSHAGPTSAQVLLGWDNLLGGCSGCPDCTPNPDEVDDEDDDQGGDDRRPVGGLSEADVRQLVTQGWLAPHDGPDVAAAEHAAADVAGVGVDVDAGGGR